MHNLQDALMNITSGNHVKNKKILCKEYVTLEYIDSYGNSLYHLIINCYTSFSAKTFALETLMHYVPAYINHKNKDGDTFIHSAIKNNIDTRDIIFILNEARNNGFIMNSKNNDNQTILHTAILYMNNAENLLKFTYALINLGFDLSGYDFKGVINQQEHLDVNIKDSLIRMIETGAKDSKKTNDKKNTNATYKENPTMKFGTILNYKDYPDHPALGREKEVNKVIISLATNKKLPLLVGPSGVGKTAIVDELAYLIKNDTVPNFLKNKLIYEVYVDSLLRGTKYRGDFEANLNDVTQFAKRNNTILFIDEFHKVFGAGASENDKSDAADFLKKHIDRDGIKIIGATTEAEYQEYMANDALKRRFEVIRVKELDDYKLYTIAVAIINNLSKEKQIVISDYFYNNMNRIINILLELTKDKNRRYDDKIYNPDLLISIIDRAFAYSIVENDHCMDVKHLILSVEDSERLYDYSKNIAIQKLNNMGIQKDLEKNRVIDFNQYKKEHIFR